MQKGQVVILGCGYTGRRVAARLRAAGVPVLATSRQPEKLAEVESLGARVERLEVFEPDTLAPLREMVAAGATVVHSIPNVDAGQEILDPTPQLIGALGDRPARLIYLSTTGVYGATREVDESTDAAPLSDRARLRIEAETAVARGPWSSLILRPAAIYGHDRGVHVAIQQGRFRLVDDGSNYVSRIHVEDLARLVIAALAADVSGCWPVADEEACTAREMAEFCARRLDIPLPPSVNRDQVHHTLRADRRVDGRAIRERLGVSLLYPSYRDGVAAALAPAC